MSPKRRNVGVRFFQKETEHPGGEFTSSSESLGSMLCLRRLRTGAIGRQRIRLAATSTTQHESDIIQMIRHSVSKFVAQEITPFVSCSALREFFSEL